MLTGHAFDLCFNVTCEKKVGTPVNQVMKKCKALKSHKPLIIQMHKKYSRILCHKKVMQTRCNHNQNIYKKSK
jgi:hypothetical protein